MNVQSIIPSSITEDCQEFKKALTPLLELGEVEEWDGRILLEREKKIRELALILAGKCIAKLLEKLSKCREAQEKALKETRGWWRKQTAKKGSKTWTILTVGNVKITLNLPYVVERKSSQENKKKTRNQGFCPFLRWLGLEKRVTPLVGSTIAEYGVMRSSFEAAQLTLKDWGIDLSIKRIQTLTYGFCQEALNIRKSKIFHLKQGNLETKSILKGQRVIISVDGGRSRLIDYTGKKRNKKTNRRRYKGEWKEPKLLTIYAVDEQGKKIKAGEVPITNDGTFGNSQELLKLLEMYLVELGINQAREVLFIADGQDWMWNDIPPLLEKLGCDSNTTYYLQDFYHVTEHLSSFAETAFSQEAEKKTWFKQACSQLKKGKSLQLIAEMKKLMHQEACDKKDLNKDIKHLIKIQSNDRINYPLILQKKLPIGSGAIESLIRQAVNLRLKGNGKFWIPRHAEAILHTRCQWLAGNWTSLVDTILTNRIYPNTS
jgi:hypothetical protein